MNLRSLDGLIPRKILLLDTGREWGGGTNSLLELLKRVDRNRFDITVLYYEDARMGKGPSIGTVVGSLGFPFLLKGRRAIPWWAKAVKEAARIAAAWSPSLRSRAVFAVDFRWRIRPDADTIARILREGRFDLLYMNNQPSTNLEGILAAAACGVPSLQHARSFSSLTPAEVGIVNRHLGRMICVSEGLRRAYAAQGVDPGRMTIVNNGIDPSAKPGRPGSEVRAEMGIAQEAVVIGTVGSLMRRKHVDLLIRALARAAGKAGGGITGLIVGEGPERLTLEAEARRLGIGGSCAFAGFQEEPLSFLDAMDVVALTSESEGLPRVLLEAMLLSKPVVASRVRGCEDLVEDGETGLLVPFGDDAKLADALGRLASDAGERARMGRNGRERVLSEFTVDRYVRGVESVLAEMAGI
jgi:glycosyltransferase involved in cell wall biosynthesis